MYSKEPSDQYDASFEHPKQIVLGKNTYNITLKQFAFAFILLLLVFYSPLLVVSYENIMWFICCLFVHNVALLLAQVDDQETSDTIIEFRAAAIQHQRVCGVHPTCGHDTREGSSCCGFCTCEDKCREHGSCCLTGYTGFPEALRSTQNSRLVIVFQIKSVKLREMCRI